MMLSGADIWISIFSLLTGFLYYIATYNLISLLWRKIQWHTNFKYSFGVFAILAALWTTLNIIRTILALIYPSPREDLMVEGKDVGGLIEDCRSVIFDASKFAFVLILVERYAALKSRKTYESNNNLWKFIIASLLSLVLGLGIRQIKYIQGVSTLTFNLIYTALDITYPIFYLIMRRYSTKIYLQKDIILKSLSEKYVIKQHMQLLQRATTMMLSIFLMQIVLNIIVQIPIIFFDYTNYIHLGVAWYAFSDLVCLYGVTSFLVKMNPIVWLFKYIKRKMAFEIKPTISSSVNIYEVDTTNSNQNKKASDLYFKLFDKMLECDAI